MTTENTKPEFDLAAFKEKRDTAQSKGLRWECSVFEITQAYKTGERNLKGANLEGAYLKGANLKGANLKGAYLEGAYLKGAYLECAYLEGAYLKGAYLEGANLKGAYLKGANLKGANLEGAYLKGANLKGANLECAYLEGAYLLNNPGIYSAYAPNLSSRGASLLGDIVIENGKLELRFWAGCKQCITAKELLTFVKETHDDNIHAQQYRAAIKFIQACFKADMTAQKWDYLLTWQPVNMEVSK